MPPVVAIAGRPNVGKSTLFNRLAGRRIAIVADTPGVTRDRKQAQAMLRGREVTLIDTAGLEEAAPDTVAGRMRAGSATAVEQADLVLFVIDAREGVTPADAHFARWLRRQGKPVLLVANKAEGRTATSSILDAYALGLGDPVGVSAEHGEGIADLMAEIADRLPAEAVPEAEEVAEPDRPLKLAIVGRPNAGKSTLLNRLLGEERMITGPEPGLTRDAVAVILHDDQGRPVELVDTAGLRRRARIEAPLEKMSVSSAIEALKMAEVVVLTIDAVEGIHDQDLQIARLIEREGRACVVALNKWDAVTDRNATRKAIQERLEDSLAQMKGLPVVTLSAMTGAGIDRLLPAVRKVYDVWNKRVPTGELNRWFEAALERHQPPLVQGRRLKLRYVTQAKARPPTFVCFGTRSEQTPEDYARYLVNGLRETFDMPGTPIRLQFRGTKNPYADG
ncbi:ribosome biogenesis GTPase Der [Rhodopila sp.]|jgi:GTP-binding protein|uniref:ribosome biogenesis GTPase Der n=1 Tax=Rhodopila sp. TaxID=2480087 RepID=UPI002C204C2F|nr:ribosome biogenesis GTPase Der [Rhodopila sp.]HVZ08052.1 ribosome biogenesis GTPase Der [Rhodopila sp.]